MKIELERSEVCKILLALTMAGVSSGSGKWSVIHDKVEEQMRAHDEKVEARRVSK